jgi:hypothetical protein
MRNFRYLFIFLIVTIVSIGNYSCTKNEQVNNNNEDQKIETRAACPLSDNYNCGPEQTLTGIAYVHNCPISYSIKYRVCEWGIQCVEPVWNLNAIWTNPQCSNLQTLFFESLDLSDPSRKRLFDFYNNVSRQIVAYARLDMVKAVKISAPGKFACTSLNPCNTGGAQIRMTGQECRRLCVNSSPIFPMTIIVCGTACCQSITPFCIDQNGNNHCIQTPTVTQISPCESNQISASCLDGSSTCGSDPCARI